MQTMPDTVKAILGSLGYESLYPPQEKAMAAGILDGKSVLVTTPTASGKTLVAMMAIAKTLQKGKKAVYLTPLRALASEKASDLKALEGIDLGLGRQPKVMVATGDYDSSGKELAFADVIVLTNEKMDTLFRHGVEWLGEVGLFVADEVHLIGDRERGPTLEMMLTRIRKLYPDAQIVALSATVSNADEISDWLACALVESSWRPTKLVEGVYEYGSVRMGDGRTFRVQAGTSAPVDLAIDSLDNGGQALIFAETRKRASSLAAKAAEGVYRRLDKGAKELAAKAAAEILDKGDDAELTRTLAQLVGKGVAFHHAGLAPSSRKIVEESFKAGVVKLLTATPTLAAGVNLPARRVVVASILRYDGEYGGNVPISVMEYKQLCGRAGRPKYDTSGEAIIVAESTTATSGEEIYDHYVLGTPEPLRSQLAGDRAIRFHLLSTIASVPGMKKPEIMEVFASTLFARQYRSATVQFKVESALEYLESEELVKARNERYVATEFGKRTSLLYIDPQTAVDFRDALNRVEKGRRRHTLGFLHLVTQSPDFYPKLALRKKDPDEVSLLLQERRDELLYDMSEYDCSRSFWALAEWMEEAGDRTLGDRMGVEPGDMHRMVETGEWLAYSLYEVAKLLGREDMLSELYALRTRIRYGIKEELIPLVALEGVGRVRARALYAAGFTDVPKVAKAPQAKLASVPKIGPAVAEKIKAQLARRQAQ
ncbi:DEAD/DEAH box helicase [Nitrososphaera viennensis]|uniref:ATP-dependent DNA helicase Hel308 n=2 Tax=Nitrososphaera viennensis TaxID=1034015 RepID=A0A060HJX0_9ARCH|nr:DEAD/DEAH box helicase [Nitrososphaera viennensis]AIC15575.1 ski2-like helicase [Nitrososphaera viennensis EN76]UVS70451.1 DEAD/DEAH box helicase [Nitrososphaera viennensis]